MPLDPRIIAGAAPGPAPAVAPFDPLQTMGRVYQLQGAQQEQQVRQLQLDAAQRAEFERQNLGSAIRGTMTIDPKTGQPTPNIPGALGRAYGTSRDPLGLLKLETEYGKSQAESRKTLLEAKKIELQGLQEQNQLVSGIAQGALQAIQQGANPQQVWDRAVAQVRAANLPTQNLPPTPDIGLLHQYANSTLKAGEALDAQQKAIDQELRKGELAQTTQRTALEERKTVVLEEQERRQAGKPVIEPGPAMQDELLALYGPRAKLTDYTTAEYAQAQKNVIDAAVQKARETGTSQIVQTPDGYFRVNPRSGAVERVEGPTGATLQPKPTTEEQRAASFAAGIKEAHDKATALENKGVGPTPATRMAQGLPFNLGNYLLPDEQLQYNQTILQFAQNLLRKESGAAISQSEYDMTNKTYFPQPGEGPEVIKQKQQARASKLEEIQREGQRARPPAAGAGAAAAGGGKPLPTTAAERDREIADIERQLQGP